MDSVEKRIVGNRCWLTIAALVVLVIAAGLLAVGLATVPARAAGENWYVNGTSGNDSWDGTSPTYVSGTIGPKATIQSGMTAAGAGDIVNVSAGTYTETGQILINKDLSIIGADMSTTIIKPAQDTVYRGSWFQVNSNSKLSLSKVTLDGAGKKIFYAILCNGTGTVDGCKIKNVLYETYYGYGVVIRGGSMTVSNNIFTNIGRDSTYVARDGVNPQPTPSEITGNSYTGKGLGDWLDYAVEIGRGARANITNNTIHNNVGVAALDGSTSAGILVTTHYAPGTEAVISGNTITDNYLGIAIGSDANDTSTVTAHLNNLEDNPGGGMISTAPPVDATENWWGTAYKPSIPSHFTGGITFEPYAVDSAMTIMNLPLPTPVYVDLSYTDGSAGGHIFGYDAFNNLKDGISGVLAYGTVNVAAGTYTESLQPIYKHVTVTGADKSTTIINGGDPYSVEIYATDVSFSGFTVMNPNCTSGTDVSGIVIEPPTGSPSNIHVHDNIVRDIGNPNTPCTVYARVGINIGRTFDGPVEVDHNEVYNVKHNGNVGNVWAEGIGIWGNGPSQPANNVDVHDNYIHDIYCPEPKAAGIWTMADVKGLKIRNNRIENTKDLGIDNWGGSQDSTLIEGNQITGSGSQGIATGIRCSDPFAANVTGNTITACNVGVRVQEHDPDPTWGGPSATVPPVVNLNRISGNTTAGLDNMLTASTAATKNWWGSVYGPWSASHTGGDRVNGPATTNPWCTNSGLTEIVSFPLHVKTLMTTGIFAMPVAAAETSTPYIKAADGVAIDVSLGSATHTITLPTDTKLTKASGASIDTGDLLATYVPPETLSGFEPGTVAHAGLQWGIPGETINFSKPITVKLSVGPGLEGRQLNVYRSVTGSSSWTSDGISTVAPQVSGGFVTFQATKASYYAAVSLPTSKSPVIALFKNGSPPGKVTRGQLLTYTIRARNDGNDAARGCKLTDSVPAYTAYVANSTTLNGNRVSDVGGTTPLVKGIKVQSGGKPAGTIAVGSQAVVTYKVRVQNDLPANWPISSVATLSSNGLSPVRATYTNYGQVTKSTTWYLAEGSTAWGFDCYISIENPNTTAVHAAITYMTGTGNVSGGTITLPAKSQTTVNPAERLGNKDFSTKVECLEGKTIAVDRTMSWTGPGAASPEAHSSIGVTSPAKTWYLPEGSSSWGFECWLLIQNPNSGPADCTVTYMIEGEGPRTVTKSVPANSRKTFNIADDIGENDASIKVEGNIPVIPERAMYRNNRREGHDSIGTTSPASDFYLAEGATGYNVGYITYVLVQNPQASPNDVTITYLTGSGQVAGPSFTMSPKSRKTVRLNDQLPPNTDVSTRVHGSQPIIAERAMYWDNGTGEACHDSIGMASPHKTFYLPDGQTSDGRETWTLVQNPNTSDVQVEISYLTPTGTGNVVKTETIPANSRRTFNMADHSGINGRAAIMVTSKTSGKKIMVERAMYWNSRGEGTDTIGGYGD